MCTENTYLKHPEKRGHIILEYKISLRENILIQIELIVLLLKPWKASTCGISSCYRFLCRKIVPVVYIIKVSFKVMQITVLPTKGRFWE